MATEKEKVKSVKTAGRGRKSNANSESVESVNESVNSAVEQVAVEACKVEVDKGGGKSQASVKDALKKCAVGFDTSEVVEEFAVVDGQLTLVKRKVTTRDIPPDIKAVKMLLDDENCANLSDEQLVEERNKLMEMLNEG
jgi:hypothetical protein